jgi:hypothetical protein
MTNNTESKINLKDKSIVLPQIELKYFGPDDDGKKPIQEDLVCCQCGKKGISIGSVKPDKDGEPQCVCEECTVDEYQKSNGFGSLEAAAAYRRRMFDVSYLFLEHLIDAYAEKNKIEVDDIEEDTIDAIVSIGRSLYDELSKLELEKITYLEDTKKLDEELKKMMEVENSIQQFFEDIEADQETFEMVDRIMKKLDKEEQAFFMSMFTVAFDDEEGEE